MNWDKIYDHMYFSTDTDEFARTQKVKDALTTLYDYGNGNARNIDILDALDYLLSLYGSKIQRENDAIRAVLDEEDYEARFMFVHQALQKIIFTIRRNGGERYLQTLEFLSNTQ